MPEIPRICVERGCRVSVKDDRINRRWTLVHATELATVTVHIDVAAFLHNPIVDGWPEHVLMMLRHMHDDEDEAENRKCLCAGTGMFIVEHGEHSVLHFCDCKVGRERRTARERFEEDKAWV